MDDMHCMLSKMRRPKNSPATYQYIQLLEKLSQSPEFSSSENSSPSPVRSKQATDVNQKVKPRRSNHTHFTLSAHLTPMTKSLICVQLNIETGDLIDQPVSRIGSTLLCTIYMKDHRQEIIQKIFFSLVVKESYPVQTIVFYYTINKKISNQYQMQVVMQSKTNHSVQLNQLKMETNHIFPAVEFWCNGGDCGVCGKLVPTEEYDKLLLRCREPSAPLWRLKNEAYEAVYKTEFEQFNCLQAHVFEALYKTDKNVFIGACTGNGRTTASELAILRLFNEVGDRAKIIYVNAKVDLVSALYETWKTKFYRMTGANVVLLTGTYAEDVRLIKNAHIIMGTTEAWNYVSLNWDNVTDVKLCIFDDIQLLSVDERYEFLLMRLRFKTAGLTDGETPRIVGLSVPVANSTDIAEYLGVDKRFIFNFQPYAPGSSPYLTMWSVNEFDPPDGFLRDVMAACIHHAIMEQEKTRPVLIWVPSNKDTLTMAIKILTYDNQIKTPRFKVSHWSSKFLENIESGQLRSVLSRGIGFIDELTSPNDRQIVETLFRTASIQAVIVSSALCWSFTPQAFLVVIADTFSKGYHWDTEVHGDYPIEDLMQMVGHAGRQGKDDECKVMILCRKSKKKLFKEILSTALPLEASLLIECEHVFASNLNDEVANGNLKTVGDLHSYIGESFLARRLAKNSYYYYRRLVQLRVIGEKRSDPTYHQCGACLLKSLRSFADLLTGSYRLVDDPSMSTPETPLQCTFSAKVAFARQVEYHFVDALHNQLLPKFNPAAWSHIIGPMNIFMIICQTFETFNVNYFDIEIRDYEVAELNRLFETFLKRHPEFWLLVEETSGPQVFEQYAMELVFHAKAFIIVLAHMTRIELTVEMKVDLVKILPKMLRICRALIDIFIDLSWPAKFALAGMDLVQAITQAVMPGRNASLWQVPHLNEEIIKRINSKGAYTLRKLKAAMKTGVIEGKEDILSTSTMTGQELSDVVNFLNKVEPEHRLVFKQLADCTGIDADGILYTKILVSLRRPENGLEASGPVHAPFFPKVLHERWWILLCEMATGQVVAFTSIAPLQSTLLNVRAEPKEGKYEYLLLLKNDAYVGRDRAYRIELDSTTTALRFVRTKFFPPVTAPISTN